MTTLKLYSPLTAELFTTERDGEYDDESECMIYLDGWDLKEYKDTILQAIEDETLPEEQERGLMEYFSGSLELDEKVLSLRLSAEIIDGQLYGAAVCEVKGTLTPEQLNELKEMCIGQYADGWGEGLEQRPRQTSEGELYVHFWQSGDMFFIRTAQEMGVEPAQRKTRNVGSPEIQQTRKADSKNKKAERKRGGAR